MNTQYLREVIRQIFCLKDTLLAICFDLVLFILVDKLACFRILKPRTVTRILLWKRPSTVMGNSPTHERDALDGLGRYFQTQNRQGICL